MYRVHKTRPERLPTAYKPEPSSSSLVRLAPLPTMENEDLTDLWRVNDMRKKGGSTYPTETAFLDALRECIVSHANARKNGDDIALDFRGRYSIVAQPRIGPNTRLHKVAKLLRETGLR